MPSFRREDTTILFSGSNKLSRFKEMWRVSLGSSESTFCRKSALLGVEISVQGVHSGFQNHMAVGTGLKVAPDLGFDRGRQSTF